MEGGGGETIRPYPPHHNPPHHPHHPPYPSHPADMLTPDPDIHAAAAANIPHHRLAAAEAGSVGGGMISHGWMEDGAVSAASSTSASPYLSYHAAAAYPHFNQGWHLERCNPNNEPIPSFFPEEY